METYLRRKKLFSPMGLGYKRDLLKDFRSEIWKNCARLGHVPTSAIRHFNATVSNSRLI